MTDLKPMELGEIVDRAAAFWRAHWKRLYALFFAFNLLQYALIKGAQAVSGRWGGLGDVLGALRALTQNPAQLQQRAPAASAGLVVVLGLLLFTTLFVTTAAAHWVLPAFLGTPGRVIDGVKHATKKAGTLAGLFLLALGWSVLVLVLCVLPGLAFAFAAGALGSMGLLIAAMVVMLLGFVGWGLWFFLRFALWGAVVASEEVSALGAFKRCDALTSGRVGAGLMGLVKMRLMVLITVVASMLLLISLISGAPVLILRGVYGNLLDAAAADVPPYLLVPAELLNLAVGAVMYPLYVAFQVIFYVDMRTRREGFDLELKLRSPA